MKRLLLVLLSIMLLLTGCSTETKVNDLEEKPIIYTSFYPLYFLTEEIGRDNIDLNIVVPHGVEAHDYEPSIKQLRDMEKIDLFIYNGAGLESWADKLLETIITEEKSINASEEVELIEINGIKDPHIWLNPQNMNIIGEKIKNKLISLDGKNKDEYEKNFNELSDRLRNLDRDFSQMLKEKKRNIILVSHNAFAYMAEAYDFDQIPVTGISPEQEPTPKSIVNIIEIAREKDLKYIFLETLANPKTVNIIAKEADLETLILNPIEGLLKEEEKSGEDYISIMEKNLENLKRALVD